MVRDLVKLTILMAIDLRNRLTGKYKEEEPNEEEPEVDITYIDAKTGEELTEEEAEQKFDAGQIKVTQPPLFHMGDVVVTYNPYTHDYELLDLDNTTPMMFEVTDVIYDSEDGIYRYYLDGEETWFAEDWLAFPKFPAMEKYLDEEGMESEIKAKEDTFVTGEDKLVTSEVDDKISEQMDEQLRQSQIDHWLDVLRNGETEEERKEARKVLTELTKEG